MTDEELEDDFGDFSAADEKNRKRLENGNHPQMENHEDHEDPFGDFASSENDQQLGTQQPSEEESIPVQQSADQIGNDDSFGDFGSAPVSDDPEEPGADLHATASKNEDASGGLGGNENVDSEMSTSPYVNPSVTETPKEDSGDLLGAFEDASNQQVSPDKAAAQGGYSRSDDENSNSWEPIAELKEERDALSSDVFGDFGATPAAPSASADDDDFGTASPQQTESNQEKAISVGMGGDIDGEDDFGDFGSAAQAEEPTKASLGSGEPPNGSAEDEDFGDFGTASNTEGDEDKTGLNGDKPVFSSDGADEDDFGDFGGATNIDTADQSVGVDNGNNDAVSPVTTKAPVTDIDDDDDFGDFGSAPPTEVASVVSPSNGSKTKDEEDVGNFDAAPSAISNAPVATSTDDDEDFGDFDSAEASAQVQAPISAAPSQEGNDDDGFGDFSTFNEEAPKRPSVSPQAKFGADFGPPKSTAAKEESDSVLQKAKGAFSKVFQRYAAEKADGEEDPAMDQVPVESLMASVDKESDNGSKECPKKALLTILKESTKEALPSAFIVAQEEGSETNAHFSVPVCGVEALSADDGYSNHRQKASTSTLPDMLPIQLSPAESSTPTQEAGATDNQTATHSEPSSQQQQGTIVQLPPDLKAIDEKDAQSEKVQDFLKRIPDLSFMLQSKLALPKTNK